MRIDHWIKNFFILPGVAFAYLLVKGDGGYTSPLLLRVLLGFLGTCLVASANYVINEWLDADFDKYHPVKKNRAVVQEDVKGKYVYILYAVLTVLGLGISYLVSMPVMLMELWLWVMGIIYNVKPMRSKDIPILDVLSESVNNAIRLLIGWFIVTKLHFPPVSIVIGYWFVGAYLMDVKRFAEYRMINDKSTAALYRKSFAFYNETILLCMAFMYAMIAMLFIGIFLIKYRVEFVILMPFLIGMFAYYLSISFKADSAVQAPEKLYREKGLMLYVCVIVIVFVILTRVNIPAIYGLLSDELIIIP